MAASYVVDLALTLSVVANFKFYFLGFTAFATVSVVRRVVMSMCSILN